MRSRSGERGQVVLETALVLPVLVVTVLGALQLATLQRARILTEYAAFNAARAGIVWNGNAERMLEAARTSLLPAFGPTDDFAALAKTRVEFAIADGLFQAAPWPKLEHPPEAMKASKLAGIVRVETLAPSEGDPAASDSKATSTRPREEWEELDFDEPPEEGAPDGTTLEVRVRYFHELRIPLANDVIFKAWRGVALFDSDDAVTNGEWGILSGLAAADRYYVPLQATYAMRMQSNFYRKWLMAAGGDR